MGTSNSLDRSTKFFSGAMEMRRMCKSAYGTKRTSDDSAHMSAFDPKRTFVVPSFASSPQLLGWTPPLVATRGAPLAASLGVLIGLVVPPPLPKTRIHHWVGKWIDRAVPIQTVGSGRLEKLGSIFTHRTSNANNPTQSPGENPALLHERHDRCPAASAQSPIGRWFAPRANVNRLLMVKDERNPRGAHALSNAQC